MKFVQFFLSKKKYIFFVIFTCVQSFASSIEGIKTYLKTVHENPRHKLNLQQDIHNYQQAENLWDVLREQFTLNHYEDNVAVQVKIVWYMRNQDFIIRAASRAAPYLYYILQQIKKRHLPAELVLLPIIESEYNPFSLSNMGASGIWQLMPGTASGYGIKQDWWYDGRRDVIASTRGALNYLSYLQSFFDGDWLLAIAAYNTGEGNVLAAIKRNLRSGLSADFWSLNLAQQTKDYVPSLLALAVIISHPDAYPLYFPVVKNAPYLAQVDIGQQINLKYAALLAGLSYKKLMALNSGYTQISTSAHGPHQLTLPIENVEQFTQNYARIPLQKKNTWVQYKVKPGDSLLSLSKRFQINSSELKSFNNLRRNSLTPESWLAIPTKGVLATINSGQENPARAMYMKSQAMQLAAKNKKIMRKLSALRAQKNLVEYVLQPGDTIYMVRATDTLQTIAHRFQTSTSILRVANKLAAQSLVAGTKLIIPTHLPTVTTLVAKQDSDVQPGDTIYVIRKGDTIAKIASKFQITAAAIRITNLVDDNSLLVGEKLVIPTHLKKFS